MKKIIFYFFIHFAITAWPFLNFYGSKANHELISFASFSLLFFIFWTGGLFVCEFIKRIFDIQRERILVGYAFFIFLFFVYDNYLSFFWSLALSIKPSYLFIAIVCLIVFCAYQLSRFIVFQKAVYTFIIVVFSLSFLQNSYIYFKNERNVYAKDIKNSSYVLKEKPNIYFLLLDTYAGLETYKKNINYNNDRFVKFFKDKGFIVAKNAHSNYTNTSTSLSATLQKNYLKKEEFQKNEVFSSDKSVLKILKENNYVFVSIPAYYDFLVPKKTADVIITPNASNLLFSLSNIDFLKTKTVLYTLSGLIKKFLYFGDSEINKLFELDKKDNKFVFIHYMQLHDFAYDRNCKISPSISLNKATTEQFTDNISCLNNLAMETIDKILLHDPKSIIIVQGDHGPSWWRKDEVTINSLRDFDMIFSIFSAVYIPNLEKNSDIGKYLSESPTPVNNFPIIFSHLAKEPIHLLPDKYFLINFKEVTDKMHSFQEKDRLIKEQAIAYPEVAQKK